MKNKIYLFIYPYQFSKFIWDLYELDYFVKYVDVHVLDLSDFLYPNLPARLCQENRKTENIHIFSSMKQYFLYLKRIKKESIETEIYLLNNLSNSTFKELFCNLILLWIFRDRRAVTSYEMYNSGVVIHSATNVRGWISYFQKFNSFDQLLKATKRFIVKSVFKVIPKLTTHRFIAGSEWDTLAKQDKINDIKFVYGHSHDYSKLLQSSNFPKKQIRKKTAIYIAEADFGLNDALYLGGNVKRSASVWYPALVDFFDLLEKQTGVEVKIASHYKSKVLPAYPHFGNRQVYFDQTLELIIDCDYVITIHSNAISYAIGLNKPIICIYSNQLLEEKLVMRNINSLISMLDISAFNIDDDLSDTDFSNCLAVNSDKYQLYRAKYLTSSSSKDPNYKIVLKEIMGISEIDV